MERLPFERTGAHLATQPLLTQEEGLLSMIGFYPEKKHSQS
jgi:hypothetical protein